MITAVEVEGKAADPSLVPAQITILHGRRGVRDDPQASSATLFLLTDEATMPTWGLGDVLTLTGDTGPMFTGRITDRSLSHGRRADGTTYGLFTVTAMGAVAALGYRTVGDEPWPQESGTARAERILTLAEVPYVIDGTVEAQILPRDVDSRPARDLLSELASSTGAAVVDLPTGNVLYQPLKERARPIKDYRWRDFPPGATWADFDPTLTWAGFSAWAETPTALPAAAVEWEPEWSQSTDLINHIRIGYGTATEGSEQAWVELQDSASIARYGRRYEYVGTDLALDADALAYASWILSVQAQPRWRLGDIGVELAALDPALRAEVLGLTSGRHVEIHTMPTPTPELVATGIVEGWTYTMWGDGGRLFERITLHTSAPLESLAVPAWSDYPPTYLWSDHDPALIWADMTAVPA